MAEAVELPTDMIGLIISHLDNEVTLPSFYQVNTYWHARIAKEILRLIIKVKASNATVVMRFAVDMTISEMLNDIADKLAIQSQGHGLFIPANRKTGKRGFWLARNHGISFYGIGWNATLEYKKKYRPLKIRFSDDTQKVVMIDDSATAREIADQVGEKLGLRSAEEFCLRKPSSPGLSKAPSWLNEQQTLHEQDVGEDDLLEFAKAFRCFYDDSIERYDPIALNLLYEEANKAIIAGRYPVTRVDAKEFAALQMQVVYGDHNPQKHIASFIDSSIFLPPPFRTDTKIFADILRDHRKLVGMREMNAKFRYIKLVRSLKTYGITFFDCKTTNQDTGKQIPVQIGVTRDRILLVDPETMKTLKEWTLEQLRRWSSVNKAFSFDFGDYEDDYVITDEAEAMSQLVAGYIDLILKTRASAAHE